MPTNKHTHTGPLRITHEDEFGIRITQECECRARRVLHLWVSNALGERTWHATAWHCPESEQTS